MEIQLTLEQLATFFFAVEGLALWKVPTPKEKTVTDIDNACEKILNGKGSAIQRNDKVNAFRDIWNKHERWQGVCGFFCSFYPLVCFFIILLILSYLPEKALEVSNPYFRGLVGLYLIIKLLIVYKTKKIANNFDGIYEKYIKVNDKESAITTITKMQSSPQSGKSSASGKTGKSRTSGKTGKSRKK